MTCSSVAFKATLKAINSTKCHIPNLFQFYVKKNAETALFLNDFPDNYLMHVGIFIFAHIAGWENQKSQNKSLSF